MKHTRLMALAMLALAVFSCKESGSDDPVVPEKYTEGYYTKWPSYSPTIHYNLKENGETYTMPTRDLPYEGSYYKVISDGWWSFFIGNNANPLVKDDEVAAKAMLRQLNEDFDYMTNVMGWPRDMAVQNGYRSAVFLYGSGLSTDDAANTETGGWQSWVEIQGRWWPILLLSYYPVHCFNPSADASDRAYQTHAVTHEGIHAMFSSMPGGKKAGGSTRGQTAGCRRRWTMSGNTERNTRPGISDGWRWAASWLRSCRLSAMADGLPTAHSEDLRLRALTTTRGKSSAESSTARFSRHSSGKSLTTTQFHGYG